MQNAVTSYRDSHIRSLLKALNWRAISTIITIIISYFVTGHIEYAITIGVIEVFAKIVIYYLHERFWHFIDSKKTH